MNRDSAKTGRPSEEERGEKCEEKESKKPKTKAAKSPESMIKKKVRDREDTKNGFIEKIRDEYYLRWDGSQSSQE